MAQASMSDLDRKNLDSYLKILIYKSIHIIVQSRQGKRIHTQSLPNNFLWFGVNVDEENSDLYAQIQSHVRQVWDGTLAPNSSPVVVETSLETADGDIIVMEYWVIKMIANPTSGSANVMKMYEHITTLLKILLQLTRLMPAYKYARQQSPDSHIFRYNILVGEPNLQSLGENYEQRHIGYVNTPIGEVQIVLYHRTNMVSSSTTATEDIMSMVKSDHFNTNMSPRHMKSDLNEDSISISDYPVKRGAFADPKKFDSIFDSNEMFPEIKLFLGPKDLFSKKQQKKKTSKGDEPKNDNTGALDELNLANRPKEADNGNGEGKTETAKEEADRTTSDAVIATESSGFDDFLMVELRAPFASDDITNELNRLCIACQKAPPIFNTAPTIAEEDLTEQLKSFEDNMKEFDDVLSSLHDSSPNNN